MAGALDEFCGSTFWDLDLVWNTTNPDFPECFQKTVLVWVPFGFLWLFAPLQVYYLVISTSRNIPWTGLNSVKILLGAVLALLTLVDMSRNINRYNMDEDVAPADFYSPFIKFVTYVLLTIFIYVEKRRGLQSTGIIFIFWVLVLSAESVTYRTVLLKVIGDAEIEKLYFEIEMVYFPLVVTQFVFCCFSDAAPQHQNVGLHRRYSKPKKSSDNVCPEANSSYFNRMLFTWFDGLAVLGYKRPLERKDLWPLNYEDDSKQVVAIFQKHWQAELLKCQNHTRSGRQPSLLMALWNSFGLFMMWGLFLKVVSDLLSFASPLLLDLMIDFVSNPDEPVWRGYLYAILILIASTVQIIIMHQNNHIMYLIGMRVRSAVISLIYQKTMRMSNSAKRSSTVGEIVNLMSVDAQRFMDMPVYINMLSTAPIQIGIALALLWQSLGPSVIAGIVVIILLIPANAFIATKLRNLQVIQMKNKDKRVKLMNELLNGMKVLKLYAWEDSFDQQVNDIRNKELVVLKTAAYINAFINFIFTCSPFLIMLATFATYVLVSEENILDANKAFVSLSLFNIVRLPLVFLPLLIAGFVQAGVSLKRMNKFLSNDELVLTSVSHDPSYDHPLVVESGTFSWGPDEDPVLHNINLGVQEGSLVAIVGPVGAGKSSLIAALLGEMDKVTGRVNTKGTIAYAAQQAWIQNATLKDNILFGSPLDKEKYNAVIEACALKPDFDMLPGGDGTEIGEKGINLSGGQKQRVSLARAVYNDSQVYFLDDPLSAVDSHVGKHIFDKVIGPNGLLREKTRIFVTHGITYLRQVDQILVLNDGAISEIGSYEELLAKKGAFAEFLMNFLTNQAEEDDEEELEELAEELIATLGTDIERRLSQTLPRTLSSGSQSRRDSRRRSSADKSLPFSKQGDKTVRAKDVTKLVTVETSETGKVKGSVYVHYLSAIGVGMGIATFILYVASQGASVGSNIWLSEWSNDQPTANGTQNIELRDLRLSIYGVLGFLQAAFTFIASLLMAFGTINASLLLHTQVLKNILRSPMSFFDTTPLGRIVNRFSKDIDVIDSTLPMTIQQCLGCFLSVVGTLVAICISTPIFMAVIPPVGVVYYIVQLVYIASSRQLKRLESSSRSPIYSHFSESINGAASIRAYNRQGEFIRGSEVKVDENQICYFPSIVSNRWLAVRLAFVGNVVVFFSSLFAVLSRETMNPGIVGLSVSYAMSVTGMLNMMVRTSCDLENNIVAVERIKEYCETPQEAEWDIENKKPPKTWPENGAIEFRNYSTRYRSGLDLILNGITCSIGSGEKIGIVGRTGAGKSSLTLALFRLIEPAGGTIIIDGVDVAKIGLHDLRMKLTIIPQDPVLFSGSLRINLDPFNSNTDEELWRALEHSHLKNFIQSLPMGLQHEVTEGGENLSVGQRQLVCLARALLRKTKVLVLDEATAAVDLETDDLIQATISKEFSQSTVIVIAHRLNTIMDSNRVLVLDRGTIKEFDSPSQLLQDSKSVFYSMAKDAGLV